MRKISLPALLMAAILTACAHTQPPIPTATPEPTPAATTTPTPSLTPTPSPTAEAILVPIEEPTELWGFPIDGTHDAFEVDTKGKLGTVLVTVEIENEDAEEYQFSVWTQDDLTKPVQIMSAESFGVFHWKEVMDANFDGYTDFGYMYAMGNQPCYWHYWIWDEAKGRFIQEPEFDQISGPQFDEETGIISGYARNGFAGLAGVTTYHKWMDGKLVCVRRIETNPWEDGATVTVEEQVNGKLTTVFQADGSIEEVFSEVRKWDDLSYHG